jgi:hypothetical protein
MSVEIITDDFLGRRVVRTIAAEAVHRLRPKTIYRRGALASAAHEFRASTALGRLRRFQPIVRNRAQRDGPSRGTAPAWERDAQAA